MGGVNTNYINNITIQPVEAFASGYGCPQSEVPSRNILDEVDLPPGRW